MAGPRDVGGAPGSVLTLQSLAGNAAVTRALAGESSDPAAATSGQDVSAPVQRSAVHDVLASPGRPLDAEQRREFEGPLGADLSEVRVHTGGAASSSAAAIGARAYTSGNDVVFGGPVDRHTLAHELAHVVQQRRGPVAGTDNGAGLRVSDPGDRFEREAEATAAALTAPTSPIQRAADSDPPVEAGPDGIGVVVQRAPTPADVAARRKRLGWRPRPQADITDPAPTPAADIEARRRRLGWRPRPQADITDQILGWRRDRPSVPPGSRPSGTGEVAEAEADIADQPIGWGPPATFFPAGSGSSAADEREDEPVAGAAARPPSEVSGRTALSPLEWLRPVRTRPGLPLGPRLRPGRPGPARVATPEIEEVLREDPQPPAVPEKDVPQPPPVPEKDVPTPPAVPEKEAKTVADRLTLGGDDQILKIGEPRDPSTSDGGVAFDDNVVIDFLSNALKNVVSPRDLQIAEQRWAATLSAAALQPMLSSMTRGDVLSVPLDVGGWTGQIKVSARVVHQAKTTGTATVEFEAGGDRFATGVGLSENRDRREGQGLGTVSPKGVSVGLGARVLRDNVTGETVSSGGRSFARTKTKEDKAQLFYTEIQMQFDFSDVKGPRRLGVGPRRQVPETGSKPIGATVARPPAGDAAAASFWPPARVQETRALGGMDVVTDVRALDKSLKPSASGVSALFGTKDDRTSLEAWGSGLPDWPTVRKDILAHLSMSSLQRDLKAMMVGKGIEVPLSKNLGSVWIGAEANWMSYRRPTKETEFNVGSDSSRGRASSEGRNTRGEITVPIGISPLGETAVTGSLTVTPAGEYGRENREGDQASARTGTALKMKVPGAVFDGRAMLTFRHSGVGSQATAMIGFRAIIDAAELESKGAEAPRAWSAGGGPRKHSMAAPVFAPNTKIRTAEDGLVGGADQGRGGTGLPADVVILDVLAGEEGEHNLVADEVADWGKGYFGASWADLKPVVLGTFSRERLAASIPAMTRKVPLQSPPLIRAQHDPAWVWGTAKLEDLSYVRELSSKAELNVLNDVSTSANAQRSSYYGGGGQIQGGPRVPLPAETSFSPSFLVGARQRQRGGMRQAVAIANTANGKFEKPMVVFIGEATVDLRVTETGKVPGRIMKAPVRFVVALPKSYTKESLAPGSTEEEPTAEQAQADAVGARNSGAAAPAPARTPLAVGPPARVTKNGQIGASDVIVRLDNDLAVVNALKAELEKDLGVNWHTFEAKVLPIFDRAAIQPLVPALTHGHRVGTSVSTKTADGSEVAATVSIVGARANMTEHVQSVKKFEFEVGSDSTAGSGTSSGSRTRFTGRTQLAASAGAGHVTSTGAGGATVDIFSEGSVDSAGGLVARTKLVEPAELYKGEVRFLIDMNLGGRATTIAASMPGQFAFPARDTSKPAASEKKDEPAKNAPEAPAKKDSEPAKKPPNSRDESAYRQPARITNSRRLGSTDVVLELFPQKAGAAASRLSPVRRPEPSAALIVEQLAHEGSEIFGSPENWAAVRPVLVDGLNPITLKPRLKSMMAGQGLRIDLGKHGRVTVTASVEGEMSHVENTRDPAEFNSGATSGLVLGGTADGRPSAETRIAYQAIGGMTGNPSPSASITPGFTTTHERGKDLTADYLTSRQRGVGTKSKVPGSIFTGVALLHFRFDRARSLTSTINPEFSAQSKRQDQRIAELTKEQSRGRLSRAGQEELRGLLTEQSENIRLRIGMRQDPGAYTGEQFAPKNIDRSIQGAEKAHERLRGTPGADEAQVGRARTQLAELAAAKDVMLQDRVRITGSRMGLARVPFTVLIETKDALKVENGPQGEAGEPPTLRLPDVEKGLRPDHIVRDLPDVHSLYDLLDAVGPQIYGSAWKTHGPMVHKDFSLEKLRAGLAGMTIGRPLTSHQFSVRLRPARIEATAEVVAQGFERVEPKADVAWVGENTSRFRERERVSKLSQFIGQIGASLGLGGVRFAGGSSHRTRVGTEAQTGGRLITNAKVTQSQTHLSGHVKFNFTFYPGPLGTTSITHSGVVPFTISVPTTDTKEVAKTQLPEEAELEWDGPTPRYPKAADALVAIQNDLARGPEGAACIVQVRRPGQAEARQYRAVNEVVNERSRILWYETRSNAPTSAPWNARTIKAYFLPPPPPPKDRV
ncbi:DUF4157 domain-containing protein [Pseudonocardia alaniniphila]|uniref:DUF4157 domain-containing protein n=1 Tax=Pseudonocardia alaniniphila TaxID=75291 RepID=A0ABS9TC38_9PSEU|nr:DUF4157 domain-containing protein [Pseudonocardia alaniniphila]MCH6166067.1 DUF4157 domain-containing protein [Pseudonocardia alaniniphila]